MSNIDNILNALSGVKKIGQRRHKALCPVHQEKTPSLHITELDGDRIVMHCFGCGANGVEICQAAGIDLDSLFPEKLPQEGFKRERTPFPASDILKSMAHEAKIISMAAEHIAKGFSLAQIDSDRITMASILIDEALNYAK